MKITVTINDDMAEGLAEIIDHLPTILKSLSTEDTLGRQQISAARGFLEKTLDNYDEARMQGEPAAPTGQAEVVFIDQPFGTDLPNARMYTQTPQDYHRLWLLNIIALDNDSHTYKIIRRSKSLNKEIGQLYARMAKQKGKNIRLINAQGERLTAQGNYISKDIEIDWT